MSLYRIAQILDLKYGLTSFGASPRLPHPVETPAEAMLGVKKDLAEKYKAQIINAKDQTLQYWSNSGYRLADAFLEMVKNISDSTNSSNNNPKLLFENINYGLGLTKRMVHSPVNSLESFKVKMVKATQGLTQSQKSQYELRLQKARKTVEIYSGILESAARRLQRAIPEIAKIPLLSTYELAERRRLSDKEITDFLTNSHEAAKYNLDKETFSKILLSNYLMYFPLIREELTTLINGGNNGEVLRKKFRLARENQKPSPNDLEQENTPDVPMPVVDKLDDPNQEDPEQTVDGDPDYADPSLLGSDVAIPEAKQRGFVASPLKNPAKIHEQMRRQDKKQYEESQEKAEAFKSKGRLLLLNRILRGNL